MQGAQRHLARVDARLVQRATKQFLQSDQTVLVVQKQHGKHFVRAVRDLQAQHIGHRLRRIEHWALAQPLGQRAAHHLGDGQQLGSLGWPQALDRGQRRRRGLQQAAQATEALQQALGQCQNGLLGGAGAQQQRQQLGVGQGLGAARQQLLARSGLGWQFAHHGHLPAVTGFSTILIFIQGRCAVAVPCPSSNPDRF